MSKLIELIGRLGQQSSQPIGFGALAGRAETAPTMALLGAASLETLDSDLDAVGRDSVDAVVFYSDEILSGSAAAPPDDLVWGASCQRLDGDELEALVSAGCDFALIELENAPANVVSFPDLAVILTLEKPLDRETAAAVRALGVSGSLNTSGIGTGELGFGDLVEARKVGASTGGAMLMGTLSDISAANLTALRDAGMDGVIASLSDTALAAGLARTIGELPPRRRPERRGLQAAAPPSGG